MDAWFIRLIVKRSLPTCFSFKDDEVILKNFLLITEDDQKRAHRRAMRSKPNLPEAPSLNKGALMSKLVSFP